MNFIYNIKDICPNTPNNLIKQKYDIDMCGDTKFYLRRKMCVLCAIC